MANAIKNIDLRGFNNYFVIRFGVPNHEICADTLANALIGISSSVRVIDSVLNYGSKVDFIIESTGQGSFKVVAKNVRTGLNNLFSQENVKVITLSLISSAIWYYMGPKDNVNIIVNTDEYIVEANGERIILPRESETYFDSIRNNPKVKSGISKTFEALKNDDTIESVSFHDSADKEEPNVLVERKSFEFLSRITETEDVEENYEVDVNLVIIKAILEKSLRKWQFSWNGKKISAPILHFDFYTDFIEHKVMIAPGDTLDARLRVIKRKDIESGLFVDKEFEITHVYKHNSIRK